MSCAGCAFKQSYNTEEASFGKLDTYDWLGKLPDTSHESDLVEVRFKNTRKIFFRNKKNIPLKRGSMVVVQSVPGFDLGMVSLTGRLAELQFKNKVHSKERYTLNVIYRKAEEADISLWKESRQKEYPTLLKARQFVQEKGLEMKLSEVEYHADGRKAIFYYTADNRVDFRELVKLYRKEFDTQIEMKQIGARQEAGMIGGIGSCGRELCCSSWRTDFSSVSLDAARVQELPLNAQKLAGQCGKLKCCLLYELDQYLEAREDFPDILLELNLEKGDAKVTNIDVLKKLIWYVLETRDKKSVFALTTDMVKEVINMNKRGIKPEMDSLKPLYAGEDNDEFVSGLAQL